MKVTRAMLHPELRFRGAAIRLLWPAFTVRKLRVCNRAMRLAAPLLRFPLANRQDVFLPREDGSHLRLCIYAPKTRLGVSVPGLLWLHGGGYALGCPEQDTGFIRRFLAAAPCVIVAPAYTLSPHTPYPAALKDAYHALLWLRDNAARLGVRTDQLFVGGDSAGGGLTAALCLYARDKGGVSIAFQMPLYPMLDDRMASTSMRENDAPIWNAQSNAAAWQLYLGERFGKEDTPIYAAPSRADDLSHLPPALSFVGEVDPFRDEAAEYFKRLSAAGVPVSFRVFPGCFHGFDLFRRTAPGREAAAFLLAGFCHAAEHCRRAQPE